MQNELAPLAIGADPDTKAELTNCLLCLVYLPDNVNPPVEWQDERRAELAEYLYKSLQLESGSLHLVIQGVNITSEPNYKNYWKL